MALSKDTKSRLCEDVIENLKSSGTFDNIREQLFKLIWDNESFKTVEDRFIFDCKKYCNARLNLNDTRAKLRKQLSDHQDYDRAAYRIILKTQVNQMMEQQKHYVESEYYKHGGQYLKNKFSNKEQEHLDNRDVLDMEIESPSPAVTPVPSPPVTPVPSPAETPVPSPTITPVQLPPVTPVPLRPVTPVPLPPVTPVPSPPVTPVPSPLSPKQDFEELTMSSVSSIETADLSDFDDSIKLSEDEASIVGVTKNAKICIDEVKTKINSLQTKIPAINNDDASGSEKRTRKVNPKYNNDDFLIK